MRHNPLSAFLSISDLRVHGFGTERIMSNEDVIVMMRYGAHKLAELSRTLRSGYAPFEAAVHADLRRLHLYSFIPKRGMCRLLPDAVQLRWTQYQPVRPAHAPARRTRRDDACRLRSNSRTWRGPPSAA
jgi:hypothetical protein